MDTQDKAGTGITKEIFVNRLFDANTFADDFVRESQRYCQDMIQDITTFQATLRKSLEGIDNWGKIEANVSTRVIVPLLQFLGWSFRQEETYTIQGKPLRPDFVLFQDEQTGSTLPLLKAETLNIPKGSLVFLEAKSADTELNTGKTKAEANPYGQLLEYLAYARLDQGFLCNGREIWLVDTSELSTGRRYVKVDLLALATIGTIEDWQLFYLLFAKKIRIDTPKSPEEIKVYGPGEAPRTIFEYLLCLDWQQKNISECELRNVIYGTGGKPSMIELVGKALYRTAQARGETPELADIFINAQYFAFRLLFLAFFESKYMNSHQLPEKCDYASISLLEIFRRCEQLSAKQKKRYTEWRNLRLLFNVIDKGDKDLFVPLFNGGLFSNENAPMLAWPLVFNNGELFEILNMLFKYEGKLRDYSVLSVTQLGTIYEGLLGFEFRVAQETTWYLDYQSKEKDREEGYFNAVDYYIITDREKAKIFHEIKYEKGNLYFVSNSNSRKTTASYYTPSSLSVPLVRRAIDHLLANMDKNESILDVRILDSACGSGHLLVETLNYLTRQALAHIDDDLRLNDALAVEKRRIAEEFIKQGLIDREEDLNVDETAILKRILLKKNIYGVDIQKFSIELTCLSLWIETFIFGTPLSFLEHHIKQGNALMGCNRSKFERALTDSENEFGLLKEKFQHKREILFDLYKKLSGLRDTTADDILQSKHIYKKEIQPIIDEINIFFDCLTMKELKKLQGEKVQPCRELFEAIDAALHGTGAKEKGYKVIEEIRQYKQQYAFFNWQLEFPEAFANGSTSGFHVIIGNPPWDKTKFSDADFFSQYRSNYRMLSNSKKKEIRLELLDSDSIAKKYKVTQENIRLTNEYYKNSYPKNAGAGDGNLFRFFVEKNLSLLRYGGTLNYILPTGFMTEDSSEILRKYVLETHHILAFDGFENRKKLFPDIHSRYKFGLLQIEKSAPADSEQGKKASRQLSDTDTPEKKSTRCRFMLTDPAELADEGTAFNYTLQDVQQLSSDHWAFMEVRHGREDLDILSKLYGTFAPLAPSWIDFRYELHATNDKGIFKENRDEGDLPLYKGACIWQYDSRYWDRTGKKENAPQYWLNPAEFDSYLQDTEINRLIAEVYEQIESKNLKGTKENNVLSALKLLYRQELQKFIKTDRHYFRICFRDIARDTDERTLIAAVIPPNISAQHTLFLSIPKKYKLNNDKVLVEENSINRIFFLQSIFNSLVIDWIIRFSTAIHVSKTYLMRLPIPQPTDDELDANPIYAQLVKNSLLLSYFNNKKAFKPLLERFEIQTKDVPSSEKNALALRAMNDILVANLYGITKNDMQTVLKGFPILSEKNPEYPHIVFSMFDDYYK